MKRQEQLFLRVFDVVAEQLRAFKSLALEIQARGEEATDLSAETMWNQAHDNALDVAWLVEIPEAAQAVAAALLHRLNLWKELARQTREMKIKGQRFHVGDIWEPMDERALTQYEALRAGLIGQQELPFMEVSA